MSINQKPNNQLLKTKMTIQEHNEAIEKATQIMETAILSDDLRNIELAKQNIRTLFFGTDTLTDDEVQDIYEMALSIIQEEL